MTTIWDLISQLLYISSLVGVVPGNKLQAELAELKTKLTDTLGPDRLYILHRHEHTGGRDWPEDFVPGVFTSRFAAASYLCDHLAGNPEFSEDSRAAILEYQNVLKFEDGPTYTILPVRNGLDPRKLDDHG